MSGGERQSAAQGLGLPGCSEEAQNCWDLRWPHLSLLLPRSLGLGPVGAAPGHLQGSLAWAGSTLLPWHRGRSPSSAVTVGFVTLGLRQGKNLHRSAAMSRWQSSAPSRKWASGTPLKELSCSLWPQCLKCLCLSQLEVSQTRAPRAVTPVWSGSPWEFWLSGAVLEPNQALPSLQTGLVTAPVACKSCGDGQGRVSPPGGGDRKQL